MNQQLPEPAARGDGHTLDVHSVFLTVQGEGPFSGRRAVFVRLAGCNLQCPGCDTEYTEGRRQVGYRELVTEVTDCAAGGPALVVITGGEPLRQPIGRFVHALRHERFPVQIESNGTLPPDELLASQLGYSLQRAEAGKRYGPAVTLVVSPKTKRIHPDCQLLAGAFKYVLDHRHVSPEDGLPTMALGHERGRGVARPRPGAPVYLTPCDEDLGDGSAHTTRNRAAVAQSAIKYGHIAQLQIHKYMQVE